MANLFLIPLVIVGLLLLLLALRELFIRCNPIFRDLRDACFDFSADQKKRFDQKVVEMEQKARKREFHKWVEARMNRDGTSNSLNEEILDAYRLTPVLRELIEEEIPATTQRCCKVHRLMALAAKASYIREVAREPECRAMRSRVIFLVEGTVEETAAYHFILKDDILLQDLIGLRKGILSTCRNCPYLDHATSEAPLLCYSAKIARTAAKNSECYESPKQSR